MAPGRLAARLLFRLDVSGRRHLPPGPARARGQPPVACRSALRRGGGRTADPLCGSGRSHRDQPRSRLPDPLLRRHSASARRRAGLRPQDSGCVTWPAEGPWASSPRVDAPPTGARLPRRREGPGWRCERRYRWFPWPFPVPIMSCRWTPTFPRPGRVRVEIGERPRAGRHPRRADGAMVGLLSIGLLGSSASSTTAPLRRLPSGGRIDSVVPSGWAGGAGEGI